MSARVSQVPKSERPISEEYRIVAKKFVALDNAARVLEELKTTVLEESKSKLIAANPDLSETKAERLAKSAPEWRQYLEKMCAARGEANLLRQQLTYITMKHREWVGRNADARQEQRLTELHP